MSVTSKPRAAVHAVLRVAVIAAAGFALSLAFPPRGWAWIAPLAVAAMTLCLYRRSAWAGLGLGLIAGFATFLPLIDWMRVVGDDAWVLLSLLCASWAALTGLITALVTRLPLWPLWVACGWVGTEALRDRFPWNGFAWGRLAFSQSETPLAYLATVGGAPLVTFAVALSGALVAAAVMRAVPSIIGVPRWGNRPRQSTVLAAGSVLAAVGVLLGALVTSGVTVLPEPGTESQVTAAVVQGNVPKPGLGFQGEPRQVLDNHLAQTEALAGDVEAGVVARPDLVIWPENASDTDPAVDPQVAADIQAAVDRIGVPVLVGAVVDNPVDPQTVLNQGIVWGPGSGPGQRYSKQHPVPFGEYIPLRPILSRLIDRFALIPRDFAAGGSPGVLQLGQATIGDVICFEVADDEVVRGAITGGGRILVVQTNNATYGYTGQPEQQLAITRLRAIEHARPTLVAATSGISAIITPRGDTTAALPEFVPGALVATVTQTDALTLSDRLGARPEWGMALIALAAVLWAGTRRRLGSDATVAAPPEADQPPLAQEIESP